MGAVPIQLPWQPFDLDKANRVILTVSLLFFVPFIFKLIYLFYVSFLSCILIPFYPHPFAPTLRPYPPPQIKFKRKKMKKKMRKNLGWN